MDSIVGLSVAGLVLQSLKLAKRVSRDKKLPRRNSIPFLENGRWVHLRQGGEGGVYAEEVYDHEFSACMIDNVYARDKGKRPEISFEIWGYKRRDDLIPNVGYNTPRWMVFERIDKNGGLVRLRLEDDMEPRRTQDDSIQLPKFIVAVRGTIISKKHFIQDIRDDSKILLELACNQKKMYEPLKDLLSELHRIIQGIRDDSKILLEWACNQKKMYEPLKDLLLELHRIAPGSDSVWVAGHSLGASVVHVATLRLAEETRIVLPTHLFNPPTVSIDVLVKKLAIGMANGLSSGAEKFPAVGHCLKKMIQCTASATIKVGEKISRNVGRALNESIFTKADERKRKLLEIGYRPHRYVNPHDPVCNEYIGYIERNDPPVSISVPFFHTILSIFLRDDSEYLCDSCYLIPPGFLHISEFAEGPAHAHKLTQWYLHEPKITSKLAG